MAASESSVGLPAWCWLHEARGSSGRGRPGRLLSHPHDTSPSPFSPGKVEAQHVLASAPTDRNLCRFRVSGAQLF